MSNIKHSKVSISFANMVNDVHNDYRAKLVQKKNGASAIKRNGELDVFINDKWAMRGRISGSIYDVEVSPSSKVSVDRINAYFDLVMSDEEDKIQLIWENSVPYALNHKGQKVELRTFVFYNFEELYKLKNGYSNKIA